MVTPDAPSPAGPLAAFSGELLDRKAKLSAELAAGRERECALGRHAYIWSQCLFTLALLCSVGAAICGLFFNASGRVVGGIAALPPLIAFLAVNLKLEERANWHYRKSNIFEALNSRLAYQLPETPTADNIAAIARDRDRAVAEMEVEWERTKSANWSQMLRQKHELMAQMPEAASKQQN